MSRTFTTVRPERIFTSTRTGATFTTTRGGTGAAGRGVPTGGTTAQVLAKASGADYDFEWVDQAGGVGGAGEVYVQADAPAAPTDAAHAVWLPIPDGLVGFADFRVLPDGPLALAATNGPGSRGPVSILDVSTVAPEVAQALVVEGGALRCPAGTPTRAIINLDVGALPDGWRLIYAHAGLADQDAGTLPGEDTTLNMTFTDESGNGYIMHCHTIDLTPFGGSGLGSYLVLGKDVADVADVDFSSAGIFPDGRIVERGDIISLQANGDGTFTGRLNGSILSGPMGATTEYSDSTFDLANMSRVSFPINNIHTDGATWRNGILWLAITDGADFNPSDLRPPHYWNGTAWVPGWVMGDAADPDTAGGGGGVETITVTAGIALDGTETYPVIGLDWPVVRAAAGRPELVYPDDLGKHLIATSDGEGHAVPWWADPEVPDSAAQPPTAYLQPDGDGKAQWGPALGTAAFVDTGTDPGQVPTNAALAEEYDPLGAANAAAAASLSKSANLSDVANASTARSNLGVAIGTNVQAYSAELAAVAALTGTTFGRGFITLPDHAALMTKLALVAADIPTIDQSQVTNLTTDLAAKVPTSRTVAGLDLSADRTAAALRAALGIGGVPLGTPSGGSQNYGVPGVAWSGVTANTAAANTISYLPFIVTAPITVDRLVFECTTLNSGKSVVMGIYAATTAWQPTGAALADTGAVSVTTTGVKASTVSAALDPGRYLLAFLNEHASTGVRFAVPTQPSVCEIDAATMGGTNNIVTTYRLASLTFATSLPNTGPAWTSTKGTSPAVFPMILMRWSLT